MKVIGFVNRFSRGIQRVQEELKTNGNEEADFNLALETAFLVKVNISKRSFASKDDTKEAKEEAKAKDDTKDDTIDDTIDDTKDDAIISLNATAVYLAIVQNPTGTREDISSAIGVSSPSVGRALNELKQKRIY